MLRRLRATACTLLVATLSAGAAALETDQYYAWGHDLEDATEVLNAKVNLEILAVLAQANRTPERTSCEQITARVVTRLRGFIFHELELWAVNTRLLDRSPAAGEQELAFRDHYLYRITGPLDLGTKVPPSPTVELNGIRFGTDKLSHFVSEGWMYYKWYRKARRSGLSHEAAEERAIRRGIFYERTILGMVASGVFSIGDLEANYEGMRFLLGLCEGDEPALERTPGGWRQVVPFDFAEHVTPDWDESYLPPIYAKRRWRRVRPVLLGYCGMLHDPWVVQQRLDYAARDRPTVTRRILQEKIDAGKLRDPQEFTLRANCPSP